MTYEMLARYVFHQLDDPMLRKIIAEKIMENENLFGTYDCIGYLREVEKLTFEEVIQRHVTKFSG
jgi:hypothetical protein